MGSSSMTGYSPAFSNSAAQGILDSREREKKDLADLNDRLASYIEKVRFLEAQNRKMAADLEALRNRWGKDTSTVKAMYEGELGECRKLIDDTSKAKHDLEGQLQKLKDDLADAKRRYEDAYRGRDGDKERMEGLIAQLSDAEAEIGLLRRRTENIEDEVNKLKRENARLITDLQKARTALDQETLNRIDYQNQVQTLLEEIEFLRRVHEQEVKELQALAGRDTTAENREFFRNELAMAIRDIRAEYDQIQTANKTDMESWYKLKVQEIQTATARTQMETSYSKEEVKRLRSQLGDLRGKLGDLEGRNMLLEKQVQELSYQLDDDQRQYESALNDRDAQIRKMREECSALMVELQMLLDTKQTLDAEISIYRKMLEGEDSRSGLKQLVENVFDSYSRTTGGEEFEGTRVISGDVATRTSFQRSAKGNVSILECDPQGRFISLENTHRAKEENLDNWKLKRRIDNAKELVYTLPPSFILRGGARVKIWARNQGGRHDGTSELIFDGEDNWGTGSNVSTILYNKEGEERATHIQRSSQH
jgi:intermediate filament protein if